MRETTSDSFVYAGRVVHGWMAKAARSVGEKIWAFAPGIPNHCYFC